MTTINSQHELVEFLKQAESYPHPVLHVRHVETHISHVFLTGGFAYKLKKAVKYDFLDFSTPEKRHHCCKEELRLNSRFAPELYLDVIPISRADGALHFGPVGEVVEHVIMMRQFDEDSLFDRLASRGELRHSLLLQVTDLIARFHKAAEAQPKYWSYDYVTQAIKSNLLGCGDFSPAVLERVKLDLLEDRSSRALSSARELIERRQKTHVRTLHGDLHLKNMCVFQNRAQIFDGIEFNPELSNCDVWADLAFFIMDLLFRDMKSEAALVWNHYLQETDDFEGFQLLGIYLSYRASIRARISCLEIESAETKEEKALLTEDARKYLSLALRSLESNSPQVICVGGLSGTGKSTISSLLAQRLGAVHIRSDAVRKHLLGISPNSKAPDSAYSEETSIQTYRGLLERASFVLASKHSVILDAMYHTPSQRREVEALAQKLALPFVGFWCEVAANVRQERVRMRVGDISDADESVVSMQESYDLGDIEWHRIDTSQNEQRALVTTEQWL